MKAITIVYLGILSGFIVITLVLIYLEGVTAITPLLLFFLVILLIIGFLLRSKP
nr:hypothetical protein [Pseudopedobacter sp.]